MIEELIGRRLSLRVSEPYEFRQENNPYPIECTVLGTVFFEGKDRLLLRSAIRYQEKNYDSGIVGARYQGEYLYEMLAHGQRCTINAEFIPCSSGDDIRDEARIRDLIDLVKVPRESRLLLIGDVSLV